jgi:hypothetical protein
MAASDKTIVEGALEFTFPNSWHVIQYDKHPDYKKIECLDGTKAVDFVVVHREKSETLYLIEVKDFRGYRIKNKARLSDGKLAMEVGHKVRDTLAGIIGGYRGGNDTDWKPVMEQLAALGRPIKVVLWLEEDARAVSRPPRRGKQQHSVVIDDLKKRLRWLTTKVFVASLREGTSAVPGLRVKSLPMSE